MIRREPLPHVHRQQHRLFPDHGTIRLGHDSSFLDAPCAQPDDTPFCDRLYDVEIRKIICSTNAIESINARYRRAVRSRGHFPNEQAALKCLYLVTRSLDPTGKGKARWAMRWKPALNAFAITFDGRINPAGN